MDFKMRKTLRDYGVEWSKLNLGLTHTHELNSKLILISIEQQEDSKLNIEDGLVWIGFSFFHVSAISPASSHPLYLYHSLCSNQPFTFDHSNDLT